MSALDLETTPRTPFRALFHFTEEHAALREVLRQFFGLPTDTERPADDWRRLLDDLGVDEILFGSADSESSGTPVDLAILAEEAGAALYRGPLISTAVLGPLLARAGIELPGLAAQLRRRPRVAMSATVLVGGPSGLTVSRDADRLRVSGAVAPVWDAADAGPIVCAALVDGVPALLVLAADADGVCVTELFGIDPSRPLGRVECRYATPELVITDADVLAMVRRRGELVVAAELLGVAQRAFDQTVDYAARRIQFGRTIGSFQAIKHRLADLLTRVELTRSAVYGAAWQLTVAPAAAQTEIDLAVAAALAAETATTITKAAVQLHGGIAITWEHWAHRYLRRAHAVVALTGGSSAHHRRLAELVDLEDGHHD